MREQGFEGAPMGKPASGADKAAASAGSPQGAPKTATGKDLQGKGLRGDKHSKAAQAGGGQDAKKAARIDEHQEVGRMGQKSFGESQGSPQEYLSVAAHEKNVRKTTMLLAILFGIGLLCLWFMIKKSTPSTAAAATVSAEETHLEKAIAQLIGVKSEMFNRMDEIVKKFYEFSNVQQVKVGELAKNPFKLEMFLANIKKNTDGKELDIDLELLRQEQLTGQARDMQLLSIMQSNADKGNCCMIDDKILYEGDSIRGFKVRQISGSTVSLESEGLEIVLKLSE
ncbi:MAG: hypothetical protein JSV82_06820 [Planctomycetota bacterium]|nr:MAG: hypothetical protein JSV82_06820 [Planctomycetota bacterium]